MAYQNNQTKEVSRTQFPANASAVEKLLLGGDLSVLSPEEKLQYYDAICKSLNLNPLTRPFEITVLDKKEVLYAKKDCTEQLRKIHGVSTKITDRRLENGVYSVIAQAKKMDGVEDESIGAVAFEKEDGEMKPNGTWPSGDPKYKFVPNGKIVLLSAAERANQMMRAETKAKRRVTLSICGLGITDESELEDIAESRRERMRLQDEGPEQTAADAIAEADPKLTLRLKSAEQTVDVTPTQESKPAEQPKPEVSDKTPEPEDKPTAAGVTNADVPKVNTPGEITDPVALSKSALTKRYMQIRKDHPGITNEMLNGFLFSFGGSTKSMPELDQVTEWHRRIDALENEFTSNSGSVEYFVAGYDAFAKKLLKAKEKATATKPADAPKPTDVDDFDEDPFKKAFGWGVHTSQLAKDVKERRAVTISQLLDARGV
jgi:hypothetical protein